MSSSMDRAAMNSNMDRAVGCATPTAVTAWFAMTITAIAGASTRNMDRVRGAAGDSGGECGLMLTPFAGAGHTRAPINRRRVEIGVKQPQ
jgi:hypothetical protein